MLRLEVLCLLVSLTALGACARSVEPEPLNFNTDPRILRGTWTGESKDGHSLRLEVEADAPGEGGYSVTGTFQLDGEAPVAITGGVSVPVTSAESSLGVQLSPTCGIVVAFSADGRWELCGDAPEGSPPRFEVTLLDQSAQGGVYSFTMAKASAAATDLLVEGDIVYLQGEPFTHPEAFVFTEDSHAVIGLYYSLSALGDAPSELVAETVLSNITSFPLSYRIEGEPKTAFARRGDYFLQAEVFSGAGDEARIGDLINEVYTPVPAPGADVTVEVTGLEDCDGSEAGGFCL